MKSNAVLKRTCYIILISAFIVSMVFYVMFKNMNKKYKEIDTAVDKQVQVSLNEFLDTLGENGYQIETITADDTNELSDVETVFLSKEDKQSIIDNVVSALSPAVYKELESKTELEKQKVLDELEKTIQEKVTETIAEISGEGLSNIDRETIITAVTTIVESNMLEILSEKEKISEETIKTIQENIGKNVTELERQMQEYKSQMESLKSQYEKMVSDNKMDNQEYSSFYKDYQEFLKKYASNMSVTLTTSNIVSSAEIEAANDRQVLSAKAGNDLLNRINTLSSESSGSLEQIRDDLQKQLADNSEKITKLSEVQEKLQKYTEAVKAGDEEARTKLQKELEEYSKGLDDATREHIKEVLESTTDEIDEKLEAANQSIAGLETELKNSITENAAAIEKEKTANLADVNSIIADLKKLAQDADKDADREKYEAALGKIAEKKDGEWTPKENVTPTKALSIYNSVINETKIENRITEVSNNIDSNMMKAEFSPDGTTLTITVPTDN